MSGTTTWPHEDLMSENGITIADLAKGTVNKIEKFKKETDPDLRESLDEVIYADVKDAVKKKADMKKAADTKNEIAARKAAKTPAAGAEGDVSKAPTAAPAAGTPPPAGDTPPPPAPKRRGVMGTILGLGH